jgi:hypothetical protein
MQICRFAGSRFAIRSGVSVSGQGVVIGIVRSCVVCRVVEARLAVRVFAVFEVDGLTMYSNGKLSQ